MPDQWIIRVYGKEYGPADLETLREWKADGRVLPINEAREVNVDPAAAAGSAEEAVWTTAAKIPGLFETARPAVQAEVGSQQSGVSDRGPEAREDTVQLESAKPVVHRPRRKIIRETFQIYRLGFFQFFFLTALVAGPSFFAQLVSGFIESAAKTDVDFRAFVASAFALCMMILSLALWPIYIAGIQILTADLAAGRRIGFLGVLNEAVKFWPRVALLCVIVYGSYFFWTVLPVGLILIIALSGPSAFSFFLVLLVLAFQVWMVGRLFVNFLFWQQFAVLAGLDASKALTQSKELARGGRDLPWFQRPLWRGIFLASLWFALVLLLEIPAAWPAIRYYFQELATIQDPQALLEAMRAMPKPRGADAVNLALSLWRAVLRPLVGISFVLLYFDSRSGNGEPN